jgi:nucleotide-binding universal stress UspA family protein
MPTTTSSTEAFERKDVRPDPPDAELTALGIRRILVPTKFSQLSEYAIDHAVTLASRLGASVIVCHVCPTGQVTADVGVSVFPMNVDNGEVEKAARASVISEIAQYAESRVPMSALVRRGDIATEIADVAEELDADLIVMGTRARNGFMRLVLGDPAESVMRRSHVPVLVLPVADDDDFDAV